MFRSPWIPGIKRSCDRCLIRRKLTLARRCFSEKIAGHISGQTIKVLYYLSLTDNNINQIALNGIAAGENIDE